MSEQRERTACMDCGRKHLGQAKLLLGQAKILLKEAWQGYPEHFELCFDRMEGASAELWLAHDKFHDCMAHMAEAADELVSKYAELANRIRDERLKLQDDPNYWPDFDGLRRAVTLLE